MQNEKLIEAMRLAIDILQDALEQHTPQEVSHDPAPAEYEAYVDKCQAANKYPLAYHAWLLMRSV